jgi:predicted GNAT family acetyltransferase
LVRFVLTHDPEEFAARAEGFLAERVERNVLATVLLRARRRGGSTGLFAAGVDERGRTCAAALRIPPWPLLASELDAGAAGALVEAWIAEDPAVPGVSAPPATARAIVAAWIGRAGGRAECRMRQAMHLLSEVRDPPRPARGRLRTAREGEQSLLVAWERAFLVEAGVTGLELAARTVSARLADGAQLVWDDDGPVSTLTLSPAIAGVRRIGPVYTPPEHRRRGYASSAVAAASRRALAGGASRCMLFTDLTNPTSNKIYAAVGFRRSGDWEEHAFGD